MTLSFPLTKAVAAMLNAAQQVDGTFSQRALIEQPLDGLRQDEELNDLRVDVLVADKASEPITRNDIKSTARVDIVVRQKVKGVRGSEPEREQVEALSAYAEQLDDYLSAHDHRIPTDAPWAKWQKSETVIPYSPALLRSDRLFYSLFRATYLVVSDPGAVA